MTDETTNFHRKSESVVETLSHLKKAYVDPADALNLAKKLKAERAFGYARKLLGHALAPPRTNYRSKAKIKPLPTARAVHLQRPRSSSSRPFRRGISHSQPGRSLRCVA